MARRYLQGKFTPANPRKYLGDYNNIVYRSSWERMVFDAVDKEPSVLKWCSEEVVVPYIGLDGREHRYFIDMFIVTKTKKLLVEIKPHSQTKAPRNTKRKKESTYVNEVVTYHTNQLKWEAATKWADERGLEFVVWTEKELGIKV